MKAELVERFRGRWVALNEAGDVVAVAAELGQLFDQLRAGRLRADTVQRVPGADDPLVVGLG